MKFSDFEFWAIFFENQAMWLLTGHGGSHLQRFSKTPESQQTDTVLALGHQFQSLLRREGALSTVPDVGGNVFERLGSVHFGNDPFTVVHDPETGPAALPGPGYTNVVRSSVQTVLYQLGQGLTWIRLAQGQPSDELEGIVNPEATLFDVALASRASAAALR